MSGIFKLAVKQVWRDIRAGDLVLLALTIVIAVAAMSTVSMLADSVRRGLERDAGQLLGADLVVEADTPIPLDWIATAEQSGLDIARTWQFASMLTTDQQSQLASVKAVSSRYPLRGRLKITTSATGVEREASGVPLPGQLWVDPQILTGLDAKLGDSITVGDIKLALSTLIINEPDRGMQFINVAPRAMINAEDLDRTGLVTLGSRVKYALLIAGEPSHVAGFKTWLETRLQPGQKVVTVSDGRPEIRQSLDRAQQFLTLVGLLATLIAAIAVVLGARQFRQRHLRGVAVMRCLGATQRVIAQLFLFEFFVVGLMGSVVGISIGLGANWLLLNTLSGLIGVSFPLPSALVMLQALGLGIFLLLILAWPSLNDLNRRTPVQMMRVKSGILPADPIRRYLPACAGLIVFLCWVAQDIKLGLLMAVGFAIATAFFSIMGYGSLRLLDVVRVRFVTGASLRFGLSCLIRRRHATVVQMSALAIGMMAILLLIIIRTDLLEGWQRTIAPDAPNRFMINIQTDQLASIKRDFARQQRTDTEWYPMIRGRLIQRNGQPIGSADFTDARAKQLIDREFNLSYATQLPQEAQLTRGRALDIGEPEVSLEAGLATTLGLAIDDRLVFDVAGRLVNVKVTSIRKVNWDSMKPNFFAITTPRALEGQPQTWMTAFQLKPGETPWLQSLVRTYPNITLFDVGAILIQLREVLNKVTAAVQGLFGFSVVAGMLVLVVALSSTRDERIREAALLRAFGATREQLARAQRIEFLVTGLISGLLAAAGASLIAWALATWVFHFSITPSVTPWLIGSLACVLSSWLVGSVTLRDVLRSPPLAVLRQLAA